MTTDITQVTDAEKSASLRMQIRNQIGMIQRVKTQLPSQIERLNTVVDQENVKAAFGGEYAAVKAAVDAL